MRTHGVEAMRACRSRLPLTFYKSYECDNSSPHLIRAVCGTPMWLLQRGVVFRMRGRERQWSQQGECLVE